jgi:hypothetical protein
MKTPPEGKPPWTAEDNDAGFIVKDRNRRAGEIATFYL